MEEPLTLPRWAETEAGTPAANIVEPTSGQKDTGYVANQIPTSAGVNWWQNIVYQWIAFFKAIVHYTEKWFFTDLGAGGSAMGVNGWGYSNASANAPVVEDPTALHQRRHISMGNNNGVGHSRLFSRWRHWMDSAGAAAIEGKVSVSGFGTSTNYSIEWGWDMASSEWAHRVVIKKKNGSANWFLHVQDVDGTTEQDLGVACTAGQVYTLRLETWANNVRVYIDGVLRYTLGGSAHFPFNNKWRNIAQLVENGGGTLGFLRIEPFRGYYTV